MNILTKKFTHDGNIKCNNCNIYMSKNNFTSAQIKKKGKRKCDYCIDKIQYSDNDINDNLIKWLVQNDSDFKSLEIKQISKENRGVMAKIRIEPKTTIVKIPDKCIISLDKINGFR